MEANRCCPLSSAIEKMDVLVSPSGSLAVRVFVMDVSSAPEPDVAGDGGWIINGVDGQADGLVVVPPSSSVMVTVKESLPLKLAFGV